MMPIREVTAAAATKNTDFIKGTNMKAMIKDAKQQAAADNPGVFKSAENHRSTEIEQKLANIKRRQSIGTGGKKGPAFNKFSGIVRKQIQKKRESNQHFRSAVTEIAETRDNFADMVNTMDSSLESAPTVGTTATGKYQRTEGLAKTVKNTNKFSTNNKSYMNHEPAHGPFFNDL